MFGWLQAVVADPVSFGLTNATDMCITAFVKGAAHCKQPKDYLFWDGIHPTGAGHAILAALIGAAL